MNILAQLLTDIKILLGNIGIGSASETGQTITNNKLTSIDNKTPNITGTFGYKSAANGTLTLTGSKRVLSITATSGNTASTVQINGGDIINIPILKNISINVAGNITDPTIVFTNTTSYFVSYVS